MIIETINNNNDFIKRKYIGKNNYKSINNRYNDKIFNENKIYFFTP